MFKADDFGVVEFFPDGVACFAFYPTPEDGPIQRTFGAAVTMLEIIRQELCRYEQACWRIAVSRETIRARPSKADPLGQFPTDREQLNMWFSRHSLGPGEDPKFFVEQGPADVQMFRTANETAIRLSAIVARYTVEKSK